MRKRIKVELIILTNDPNFWSDPDLFPDLMDMCMVSYSIGDELEEVNIRDLGDVDEEDL